MADLKGEEWHEDINPEINGDIAAFLPESYVIDTDVRLNLYRRLSSLRKKADLDVMAEEIRDRFGMIPPEVSNLFGLMAIRLLLKDLAASRLDIGHDSLIITFSQQRKIDTERLIRLVNGKPNRYQFLSQYKLQINVGKISLPQDFSKVQESIDALYHCYLESESSMHHNWQSQKETKDLKPRN